MRIFFACAFFHMWSGTIPGNIGHLVIIYSVLCIENRCQRAQSISSQFRNIKAFEVVPSFDIPTQYVFRLTTYFMLWDGQKILGAKNMQGIDCGSLTMIENVEVFIIGYFRKGPKRTLGICIKWNALHKHYCNIFINLGLKHKGKKQELTVFNGNKCVYVGWFIWVYENNN